MKKKEQVRRLLEEKQAARRAAGKYPVYLCYWAVGPVTESVNFEPVRLEVERREFSPQEKRPGASLGLLAFLTPTGVFNPLPPVVEVFGGFHCNCCSGDQMRLDASGGYTCHNCGNVEPSTTYSLED